MNQHYRDPKEGGRGLDEAIATYLQRKQSGPPPDRGQWLTRYSEFASELAEFFADEDEIDAMVDHLRADPAHGSQAHGSQADDAGSGAKPSDGDDGAGSTVTYHTRAPRVIAHRYVVQKFHARGGMGEVWLARDGEVGRQVALKKLRGERVDQQERFMAEAQITGQLEHPSIVPLHDLGVDEDGCPFYIMKFVHGRTLKDAILEYHSSGSSPTGLPGATVPREVQQLQLLEVFVDLCQAVAFAHSRGVLHRDVKPSNIMIGQFGETLVLDWGLAKVMAQPEGADDLSYVHVSSSSGSPTSGSSATQDGSVMGSPAYMAPEVAEGRVAEADETTDVYLLGATLYEILTGRPPREGSSNLEMLELARNVSPTMPRKIHPSVARALEAICLKAMSRRMQDRYQTAKELAAEVQRYLAGEPVSAYRERLPQRVWRWCKRHRQLLQRAAVAMVIVACAMGVFAIARKTARLEAIAQAQLEVEEFRRLAAETWYYATSIDPATERAPYYDLRKGIDAGQAALKVAQRWGSYPGDGDLGRLPLPEKRADLKDDLYDLHLLIVQARLQTGRAPKMVAEVLELLDRAATFREPTRSYYRLRADCLELLNKDRRAAQEREEAKNLRTPTTALDHFLLGEQHRSLSLKKASGTHGDPWNWGVNKPVLQKAMDAYRTALKMQPGHFWSHLQLGRCLLSLGRNAEAIEAFGACVALAPDSPWGYSARGLALAMSDDLTVPDHYERAQSDFQLAMDKGPDGVFLPALLNRGVSRWLQKEHDDALTDFTAVLSAAEDRRLIEAAYYRGCVHLELGDYREALADFGQVVYQRRDFRHVYLARARIHFIEGRQDAGRKDLDTFLQLATPGPFDPDAWQPAYHRGRWLRRHLAPNLPPDAALAINELAEGQLKMAHDRNGRSAELFFEWGMTLKKLGRLDDSSGKDNALDIFYEGILISPEDVNLRIERGDTYEKLGKDDLAFNDFHEAVRFEPQNVEALTRLAFAGAKRRAVAEAEQYALQALLMGGAGDSLALHNVACVYAELSQSDPAREKVNLDLAMALILRAVELWEKGGGRNALLELIDAEQSFPQSLRSRPEFIRLFKKDDSG